MSMFIIHISMSIQACELIIFQYSFLQEADVGIGKSERIQIVRP